MEVIYSSPLDRALYTASVVGERHRLTPVVLPELREVGFAGWEGQSIPELVKAGDYARWRVDPFFNPPEGGETWGEILWRLSRAVETILEGPQQRILIVAHGGVMRGLYAVLAGMDPHKVWNMDFSNCAISGIEVRWGRACLAFANDDLHIRAGEPGQSMPVW